MHYAVNILNSNDVHVCNAVSISLDILDQVPMPYTVATVNRLELLLA